MENNTPVNALTFSEETSRPVREYDVYVGKDKAEWLNIEGQPNPCPRVVDMYDLSHQPYLGKGPKAVFDPDEEDLVLAGFNGSSDHSMDSPRAQEAIQLITDYVTERFDGAYFDFDIKSVPQVECSPELLSAPGEPSDTQMSFMQVRLTWYAEVVQEVTKKLSEAYGQTVALHQRSRDVLRFIR
ncbi:hypothetical protein HN680_07100 [Candidatus Peregrinibacteria bacterium]|jgi:hypothetical protein|nr:hypothetical protein [Candidatus Peregrinibacteria bacterium]